MRGKSGVAKLVWGYTNDTARYSGRQGNMQRLANGYTLVNYGYTAGNNSNMVNFLVINALDSIVFSLTGINSYRVLHYSKLPWKLHRPQITCFDSLRVKYLKTARSNRSYKWSDSSVTHIITVTKPGSYFVFVPYGEGGFISSERVIVTDISKPCIPGTSSNDTRPDSKTKKNK